MWMAGPVVALLVVLAGREPARPAAAQEAYGRAQLAIGGRDWDLALSFLSTAIAADATFWEAHKAAGDCLLVLKRPSEAKASFERWAALRPTDKAAQPLIEQATREAEAAAAQPATRSQGATTRAPSPLAEPSLGELLSRARLNSRPTEKGHVFELSSSSGASSIEPIPTDAPVGLLDELRKRADSIFRPRMTAVAQSAKNLKAQERRWEEGCHGKTTSGEGQGTITSARPSGGRTKTGDVSVSTSYSNEDMPECLNIKSDIARLSAEMRRALDGVDKELGMPPAVYPGIREEVFAKLMRELWW